MTKKPVKWYGSTECDFCHKTCHDVLYDAMTTIGPWAVMCPECFTKYSHGVLGVGYGQKYECNSKGDFIKTEG